MSDLRARQKALARRTIAEAAGGLASERRHLDFSMQEVADRAGVSLRTVYNHFDSRDALLSGLVEMVDELFLERGGVLVRDVSSIDQVRDAVGVNFPIFESLGPLVGAADHLDEPSPLRDDHVRRTKAMVDLTIEAVPELAPETAAQVGLAVRHMASHRTWATFTQDHGQSTPQSSAMARWAIRIMLDAARRGDIAELEEQGPSGNDQEHRA